MIEITNSEALTKTSHIDTAQAYRNESHVGAAVRESGLKREDIFVSECMVVTLYLWRIFKYECNQRQSAPARRMAMRAL